jgi:hypothetical protein
MVARNLRARKRPLSHMSAKIRHGVAVTSHLLGAPGGAWTTHIVQFRPVGIECPGEELAPERPDASERPGASVAAVRPGGEGCGADGRHDSPAHFVRRFLSYGALFAALTGSFWPNSLKEGFNCRYPY